MSDDIISLMFGYIFLYGFLIGIIIVILNKIKSLIISYKLGYKKVDGKIIEYINSISGKDDYFYFKERWQYV